MAKTYYDGRLLSLVESKAMVKGRKAEVVKAIENDAVVILPMLDDGKIIIERQYRPVIRKYLYELPAGHIEKGESRLDAVRRELHEETGYTAGSIKYIFKAYPQPGLTTMLQYFYIASKLEKKRAMREKDEDIGIRIVRLNRVLDMIKKGMIIDSKTIAAILYYVYFK